MSAVLDIVLAIGFAVVIVALVGAGLTSGCTCKSCREVHR